MSTINILFLTAAPTGSPLLTQDAEYRQLEDARDESLHASRFRLFRYARVQRAELEKTLSKFRPHIVHYAGHCSTAGGLLLEAPDATKWELDRDTLRTVFKAYGQSVQLAVLNASHSELAGNTLREVVPYVIGNAVAVYDQSTLLFAKSFYASLFQASTLYDAFRAARKAVTAVSPELGLIPQLLDTPEHPDPREVKPLTSWVASKDEASRPVVASVASVPPMVITIPDGPELTRSAVRRLLDTHLVLSSDFEAFLIDQFPDVQLRVSSGMERMAKASLLIQLHSPQKIAAALATFLNDRK